MSEPTEADRRTADGLVSFYRGLRKGGVEDPADTGDLAAAIARALAAERAKARADIAEDIRAAWGDQCGGFDNPNACESCRAYARALRAAEDPT